MLIVTMGWNNFWLRIHIFFWIDVFTRFKARKNAKKENLVKTECIFRNDFTPYFAPHCDNNCHKEKKNARHVMLKAFFSEEKWISCQDLHRYYDWALCSCFSKFLYEACYAMHIVLPNIRALSVMEFQIHYFVHIELLKLCDDYPL